MPGSEGIDADKSAPGRRVTRFVGDHPVLVLLAPALVVLLAVFVYPLAWVLYRSLFFPPLYPGQGYRFAPAGNYIRVVTSPDFYESVVQTLFYSVGSLSVSVTSGLLVALALNQVASRRVRTVYTTLFVLVLAIPVSILALTWRWILHPTEAGLANMLLLDLALVSSPVPFLESRALVLGVVALIDAWVRMPFAIVVFLAGLQSIPTRVYEAARIDGATTLQTFRHVTLPYLRPYAVTVVLLTWVFAFQAFTVIWNMTGGGPNGATTTLPLHIYEVSILRFNLGLGAALAALVVAITVLLTAVYVRWGAELDG
jgi:multiple sugar transport system permease protein